MGHSFKSMWAEFVEQRAIALACMEVGLTEDVRPVYEQAVMLAGEFYVTALSMKG